MDVITTHLNADFDALGAMIAAKKLYPEEYKEIKRKAAYVPSKVFIIERHWIKVFVSVRQKEADFAISSFEDLRNVEDFIYDYALYTDIDNYVIDIFSTGDHYTVTKEDLRNYGSLAKAIRVLRRFK